MAGNNPFTTEPEMTIHRVAARTSARKARSEDDRHRLYQEVWKRSLELKDKHDPSRGNFEAWLQFHADNIDSKTLNSPLSFPRDPSMRFRTLLGTNETYDSFVHSAREIGIDRFEANVAWFNAGPPDYYAATFADVDSDFFGDDLAISGADVEDEVIHANTLSEIMAIFADQCDPRVYKVWNLVNNLPDWTMAEVGEQLDPPISAPTVSRDYKKAEAALWALGQLYSDSHSDEGHDVA